jgi:flagellar hook protein FlgE
MFSGVSGLAAQSQAMGMIADNITNVNTIGFKRTAAKFSTFVTESASPTAYSPGGVVSRPFQNVGRQGLLQSSASPTDISISGYGFFVVNTNGDPAAPGQFLYSRAGSFVPDKDGYLRNAAGYYLQGVAIPPGGPVPANPTAVSGLESVNIFALNNNWEPTTAVSAVTNLRSTQAINANIANYGFAVGDVNMAAGTITPDFTYNLQVYDSQGGARNVAVNFLKDAAANTWFTEMAVVPATDALAASHPNGLVARGTVTFNPDGTFNAAALTDAAGGALGAGNQISIDWAAGLGLAQSQITYDISAFTQADSPSRLISSNVDGSILGAFEGVTVGEDGIVTALFDNGTARPIYKLPLATFRNPNGLSNQSGNTWTETDTSGVVSLLDAGTQGAGRLVSGALESSTVDLAEEFANMIITQRANSASGKIITTTDEMLDELIRLKR